MKFRKKPVVIDAEQFLPNEPWQWPFGVVQFHESCGPNAACAWDGKYFIETLEGRFEATPGDWVIRGVKGEYYPCKPDIFAATYEPVDEQVSADAVATPVEATTERPIA